MQMQINTIMQCKLCNNAQHHADMITDNFGEDVCNNCGNYVENRFYWDADNVRSFSRAEVYYNSTNAWHEICTDCGHMPAHNKDNVCIDDFGTLVCTCGTSIELYTNEDLDWDY